jgi:hypothetical protein
MVTVSFCFSPWCFHMNSVTVPGVRAAARACGAKPVENTTAMTAIRKIRAGFVTPAGRGVVEEDDKDIVVDSGMDVGPGCRAFALFV